MGGRGRVSGWSSREEGVGHFGETSRVWAGESVTDGWMRASQSKWDDMHGMGWRKDFVCK